MNDLFEEAETDGGMELEGRLSYDSPRVNAAAIPAAFAAAAFLDAIGVGLVASLVFHEFGHAVFAWLAGRWAIPIPVAGLTFWGGDHSWVAATLSFALLGGGLYWADAGKRRAAFLLFAVLLGFAFVLNFLAEAKQCEAWMIYGGSAGEIVLPAVVIVAFYWRLPWRWDFWRYLLLLAAACSFLHAATFWTSIRGDPEHRMMGESLSKSRDSDADWVRLSHDHGFSARELDDSYLRLCAVCGALIAGAYLWGLRTAAAKKS